LTEPSILGNAIIRSKSGDRHHLPPYDFGYFRYDPLNKLRVHLPSPRYAGERGVLNTIPATTNLNFCGPSHTSRSLNPQLTRPTTVRGREIDFAPEIWKSRQTLRMKLFESRDPLWKRVLSVWGRRKNVRNSADCHSLVSLANTSRTLAALRRTKGGGLFLILREILQDTLALCR
jgi:hypothetical protein